MSVSVTRTELDSHADTCCFGRNALVIAESSHTVDVTPFLSRLDNVSKVPIVSCAVAYDDPRNYSTYVLIFHQVLYFADDLEHNLLCHNQLRMNGIHVYECPHLMGLNPTECLHSIVVPFEDLTIPLELDGVISYFPTCKLTCGELDTCYHIEMTPESPSWDPYAPSFGQEESALYHAIDLHQYGHYAIE